MSELSLLENPTPHGRRLPLDDRHPVLSLGPELPGAKNLRTPPRKTSCRPPSFGNLPISQHPAASPATWKVRQGQFQIAASNLSSSHDRCVFGSRSMSEALIRPVFIYPPGLQPPSRSQRHSSDVGKPSLPLPTHLKIPRRQSPKDLLEGQASKG